MGTIDLFRKVNKLIKVFNEQLKDYDIDSFTLHRTLSEINGVLETLNAYSYAHCKTFYTYYHLVENRKGYSLGADLREKGDVI